MRWMGVLLVVMAGLDLAAVTSLWWRVVEAGGKQMGLALMLSAPALVMAVLFLSQARGIIRDYH